MESPIKQHLRNISLGVLSRLIRFVSPASLALPRHLYTARFMARLPGTDPSTQCDGPVRVIGTGRIALGKGCRIGRECEFTTEETGKIILEDNVRINRGTTLASYAQVRIGTFAIIGEFTSIRDANHGTEMGTPMRLQPHTATPITIGRDVWIGRGCCILPGVTIGDGAIIGANSVVTKDIPPHTLAAGAPATVLRERQKGSP